MAIGARYFCGPFPLQALRCGPCFVSDNNDTAAAQLTSCLLVAHVRSAAEAKRAAEATKSAAAGEDADC